MKQSVRTTLAALGLLAAGVIHGNTASAQCAAPQPTIRQESWHDGHVSLMPVGFHADDDDDIVGFWNTVFTAKGNGPGGPPDGTLIDKGLQQWHADGTEFLNSSFQNPQTQNYCLGVWEKVGPRKYSLNHFAYSYDATGKVNGLASIREEVTVDRDGDRFTGTFSIQPYDALRNKLPFGVKGVIAAKRINLRTTPLDVL